ncbi:hypothetical protein TrLO_g12832 [Triparma laevis f. longispina]|uniref:Uncharacterized protein n=1 Tax=Triparma laevis f. longispina TaxID=1714387 RepID=A0A9W7ASN0_9STRA|nr:hypothetical protein TrLO_g12832 [Triparma laevis f. longispina]
MSDLLCGQILSSSPDSVAMSIDGDTMCMPPPLDVDTEARCDKSVLTSRYAGYKLTTDRSYLQRLGYVKAEEKPAVVEKKKRYTGYKLTTDRSYLKKLGWTGGDNESKTESKGNTYLSLTGGKKRYGGYKLTTDRSYLKRLGYMGGKVGGEVEVR